MHKADFKKMMQNRFGLDQKEVKLREETLEYIKMEADISTGNLPMSLIDELHWRKEEIDFCKTLENENLDFLAYYHRTNQVIGFDQRNFYFIFTDKNEEKFPMYFVIYKEKGGIKTGNEKDFFFPKNEKHDETIEALKKELDILKKLKNYYEDKMNG